MTARSTDPTLRRRAKVAALCCLAVLLSVLPLRAQEHASEEEEHTHGLHFAHPLVSESVSPDNKVRLDYRFHDGEEEERNTVIFELEYAVHRTFSVHLGLPYAFLDREGGADPSNFGNAELALKFANFAFAEHGVLLGYGMEFGLPTGSDEEGIGSDHIVELEPFLNAGYRTGGLEAVSFVHFGIPTNQRAEEPVETELGYNLSLLYHLRPGLQALLELDGEAVLSSEEGEEHTVLNLTPGAKVRPFPGRALILGVGAGFPLTSDQDFDTRVIVSAFYHF